MTSKNNKRLHQRVNAKIDVKIRNGQEFVLCYSKNISKGGIYLETEILPDPNAVVELVLDLPSELQLNGEKTLALTGRIVRLMTVVVDSKPIHKVGIQFFEVSPQTQFKLDAINDQLLKTTGPDSSPNA